jgi:hypothetical protein
MIFALLPELRRYGPAKLALQDTEEHRERRRRSAILSRQFGSGLLETCPPSLTKDWLR